MMSVLNPTQRNHLVELRVLFGEFVRHVLVQNFARGGIFHQELYVSQLGGGSKVRGREVRL